MILSERMTEMEVKFKHDSGISWLSFRDSEFHNSITLGFSEEEGAATLQRIMRACEEGVKHYAKKESSEQWAEKQARILDGQNEAQPELFDATSYVNDSVWLNFRKSD